MDGERVIGGYVLRRVLGRGGMGEVHLASTPTGSLAAVKVIHPALARDPAFRRRFEREVAAARRVARFCTAPVLDAGFDGETAYLVTEYVKGPDLAQAVREQGPFSGANLEALAVGIATALGAIHGAGVIHRDLKPSNVLLSPLGPRVIDFGIAQLVDGDASASQAILGTPAFMAPEQVRGEPLTPAADVYAWGGVIAFAGTGRLPFGGGAPHEVLYRIVNEGPVLDGLEAGMRGLVERAMAKDPRLRPTAQQLLADLMGGRRFTPETATQVVENTWTGPGSQVQRQDEEPAKAARRRWPWVVAAAGLAAVVAGAVVVPLTARESWPYTADFRQAWAVGASQGGSARQVGGAYVLTANAGWRLWKSAPRREPGGDVVISARARLEQGKGEYGVWCHGKQGSAGRYEFTLNDQGKASIVRRRDGGQPTILYGPADAKTAQDNRIVAECAGTTLRLWVNEELLAKVTDDQPFESGEAGVLAAPSGDQAVQVRFATFAVQPSKG
ncbi:serine/threonine-protein kinase [Nonomuraea sp. NPDC050536]|uniref:serine/threonine-protein kinase n=1 Tax=Nonomuraea sp. NPDC050536 TaxID=3364366 RepID=UPI0037CC7D61